VEPEVIDPQDQADEYVPSEWTDEVVAEKFGIDVSDYYEDEE